MTEGDPVDSSLRIGVVVCSRTASAPASFGPLEGLVTLRFHRILKRECVRLRLESDFLVEPDESMNEEQVTWYYKEAVLRELSELLAKTEGVASSKRLYKDLWFNERKASSGVGQGIAIPHVRTMKSRNFVLGFGRSQKGIPFDSIDREPVLALLAAELLDGWTVIPPPDVARDWGELISPVDSSEDNRTTDCESVCRRFDPAPDHLRKSST